MTPQEMVHSHFAEAVAVRQDPVYTLGQEAPVREGDWAVLSSPAMGAQLLGMGRTETDAWNTAAKALKPQQANPKLSFKEWLAQQAQREGSAQHRRQIIADWTEAIADLNAQIIRWLAEEDTARVLTVDAGTIRKEEEGLGGYDAPALRINLSSRFVEIAPVGRNVVGGIGKRGDLGLRPEGLVDMRTHSRKYMLYRVLAKGHRWVIVDDEEYAVQDLTKETFVTALQDLLS